ncbi:MAG: hypothetical protein ABI556_05610 [Gemmatimonadales bacterium]
MIRVHIERLILDGLPLEGVERARLERSLATELTRLLEMPGAASSIAMHGQLALLHAPSIRVQPGDSGSLIGSRIAQSVFGSLTPAGSFSESGSITQSPAARGPTT